MTSDAGVHNAPVWSRDGNRIAWSNQAALNRSLMATLAGSDAKPEMLLPPTNGIVPWDWSSDGRVLVYSASDPNSTGARLWALPLDGDRRPYRITQSTFGELQAQFSPDGHWIAYTSAESGRPEIYVRPFPPGPEKGGKVKVSEGGGTHPRWRRDRKELFYIAGDTKLMAVDVSLTADFKAGDPQLLFQSRIRNDGNAYLWDLSADGQRFLIATPAAEATDAITIVVNWQAALKK